MELKLKNMIILLIMLLFFGMYYVNINASTEYETIKGTSGNTVYYYGSNEPIMIPKTYTEKTEEFRGTWVSFYAGDLSSYSNDTQMKTQLSEIIANLKYYNMNAVVFHIRTHNDALYDTNLAPQSSYTKGVNYDNWDYLEWFISECHKNGIEFHAWLNPYRIYASGGTKEDIEEKYKDYPSNPAHDINNVLINDKGAAILDPGIPEVRQYIIDTCLEIIEKYDVDAIHFDDYFYINDIDDSETRKKYNTNNLSLDNFRRTQVDTFIEELSDAMYDFNIKNKRCVQLGISPTAMYKNNGTYVSKSEYKYDSNGTLTYPTGSNTSGWQHYYSSLFCDTKKWIDNEWIDYIVPQTYFAIDYSIASHAALADWWSGVVKNKKVNLYMGIGLYKTPESTSYGWNNNPNELLYQLKYDGDNEDIDGVCIYQYRYLPLYKSKDVMKTLVNEYWTTTPKSSTVLRYKDVYNKQDEVINLQVHKGNEGITLTWQKHKDYTRYAVYGYNDALDINDVSQLIGYAGEIENGICGISDDGKAKYYAVIPLSKANVLASAFTIENKNYTPLNVNIGSIDLHVNSPEKAGVTAVLVLNFITQNLGSNLKYKVIGSYDSNFSDIFVISEEKEYIGIESIRYRFNEYGKATFIKVICTNSVGTFESEVYVQAIDDDSLSISKYVYSYVKEFYDNLFKESDE